LGNDRPINRMETLVMVRIKCVLVATVAIAVFLLIEQTGFSLSVLSSPSDFSGSETVIDFEGLGLTQGNELSSNIGGVGFRLDTGSGPRFTLLDETLRQFGPVGFAAIETFDVNNGGVDHALTIDFGTTINRVAFELRLNPLNTVTVDFQIMSGGQLVDKVTFNPSTTRFAWMGWEVASGFDEIVIDATATVNTNETIRIDNLRFEVVPLPAATWMALPLLGGLGVVQLIRRRRLAA